MILLHTQYTVYITIIIYICIIIGIRASEKLSQKFENWKNDFVKIPTNLFEEFPQEFQTKLLEFSKEFLKEQCSKAEAKAVEHSLASAGSTKPSQDKTNTTVLSPLEEIHKHIAQDAKHATTSIATKKRMLSKIYTSAITRGHHFDQESDMTPIVDFSLTPMKDIKYLILQLSADKVETVQQKNFSQLLGQLLKYVPCRPFQFLKTITSDPKTVKTTFCGQCSKRLWHLINIQHTCVHCKRKFCNLCPLDCIKLYGYGISGEQHICNQCLKVFYQQHAREWVNQAISFIEAGTLKDLKAAFGCIEIATSLYEGVNLTSIAKKLLYCDFPELALPLALVIQQQSSITLEKLKTNQFLTSVLKSIAKKHTDINVRWLLLAAAKQTALCAKMEADILDTAVVDTPSLQSTVDEINTELWLVQRKREDEPHIVTKNLMRKLVQFWKKRDFDSLIHLLSCEQCENVNQEILLLQTLEQFLQEKEPVLQRMLPEDQYALLFFRGILKLYRQQFREGISDIEQVAWFAHSQKSDKLKRAAIHILLSLQPSTFSLEGIDQMITKDSLILLTKERRNYDGLTPRESQLLSTDENELGSTFKRKWPTLCVF